MKLKNLIREEKLKQNRINTLVKWYEDRLVTKYQTDRSYAHNYAIREVKDLIDSSNENGIKWLNTCSKKDFIDELSI